MFNQYPYLNINDLNLDFVLNAIREMKYEVTNFVSINAIKYADPIQWNITSQYEKNTIVIDPVTGTAYISVAPVPAGVSLTRPEYWTVVFDLGSFVTRAAQNFTSHWESDATTTATFPTTTGGWLVWGDVLYKALTNITAGDTYVVGGNIDHFTIEDLYNAYLNTIAQILTIIGDLADLETRNKSSVVNAINSVVAQIYTILGFANEYDNTNFSQNYVRGTIIIWHGKLYRVTTPVNAGDSIEVNVNVLGEEIAGLYTEIYNTISVVNGHIGTLANLRTNNKSNCVNAINEIVDRIDNLSHRRWIFIGDSWNTTDTPPGGTQIEPWSPALRNYLGINDAGDYYESGVSGSGFSAGATTFLQQLQNLTIDDPDTITDIVVLGGVNDATYVNTSLYTDIVAFKNYCKTNFPNAILTIGMISWNCSNSVNAALRGVYGYYITACDKRTRCIPYPFAAAHFYYTYQNDGGHLTSTGTNKLVQELANYFVNGGVAYWDAQRTMSVTTLNTTKFSAFTGDFLSEIINDQIPCKFNGGRLTIATDETLTPLTEYKIGNLDKEHICGASDSSTRFSVHAWAFDTSSVYLNVDVDLIIRGFELYMTIRTVDSNGITPLSLKFIELPVDSKVFSVYRT